MKTINFCSCVGRTNLTSLPPQLSLDRGSAIPGTVRPGKSASVKAALRNVKLDQATLEYLPYIVFLKSTANFEYDYVNPLYLDVMGLTAGQVVGKTDFDIFQKAVAEQLRNHDLGVVTSGKPCVLTEDVGVEQATIRFRTVKIPIFGEEGQLIYLLGIAQKLDEFETGWSDADEPTHLLDEIAVPLLMTDDRGIVVYVNRQWREYTGLGLKECSGSGWLETVAPGHLPSCLDFIFQAITSRQASQVRILLRGKGPHFRWFQLLAQPRLREGRFTGLAINCIPSASALPTRIRLKQRLTHPLAEERKKRRDTEKRLQERELWLRQVIHSNVIGIMFIDANQCIVDANEALLSLIGYTWEEVNSKPFFWRDITPPTFFERDACAFRELLETGRITPYEKQYITKDGYTVDILIGSAMLQEGLGVAFIVDISRQKELERQLQFSELKHRRIVETANEGIWMIDANEYTVFANQRIAEMLGYTPDEMLGRHLFEFMDEEEVAAAKEQLARRHSGQHEVLESRMTRKDGSQIYALVSASPLMSRDGAYEGALGMITDITERKATEIAVKKSLQREQLMRHLIQLLSQPLQLEDILQDAASEVGRFFKADRCLIVRYDMDEQGVLSLRMSSQYCASPEIAPITDQDIIDLPVCRVYKKRMTEVSPTRVTLRAERFDEIFDYYQPFARQYQANAILGIEIFYQQLPYGYIMLQCQQAHPWTDDDMNLLDDIATSLGVAFYQADLFQKTQQAKEEAERANRRKDLFLASMSHEYKTPLNAIIGYAEMLAEGLNGELPEKYQKYGRNIQLSAQHLLNMVTDLLDVAKIEAGKMEIFCQSIDLKEILSETQSIYAELAAQQRVHLTFQVSPGAEKVYADPVRLRQILYNLVSNAIKFNKPNGFVSVGFYRDNDDIIGEVTDSGIGIPLDKQHNLFTDYYQVRDTQYPKQEGTGLGLALCKKLVELHGGHISVDSQEGSGSVFRFSLPLQSRTT